MTDLPPKTVRAQLVRLDDNLKQIERRQVAGIQRAPGSLPVLEAFQVFLENENRKARRRVYFLTAAALLVMLAASIAGILIVRWQMEETVSSIRDVEEKTDALVSAVAMVEAQAGDKLEALETRFNAEGQRIIDQYNAMLEAQASLIGQGDNQAGMINTMQERLDQLELENERLKTELSATPPAKDDGIMSSDTRPGFIRGLFTSAESVANSKAMVPPHIAGTIDTDHLDAPSGSSEDSAILAVIEHPSSLLLTIRPEGQRAGIRWQLPRHLIQE